MAMLLDRVHQIGDTAALCSKRREVTLRTEELMRKERESQWIARVKGRHILRRGHILK